MTASELKAVGIALFGEGWQSKLARTLGVAPRTVRRWAAGTVPIPGTIDLALGAKSRIAPDYPDEWLVAADPDEEREYIIHLAPPRFIARLGDGGARSGLVMSLSEGDLFDFSWIDPQPGEEELRRLLKGAQRAVDIYS